MSRVIYIFFLKKNKKRIIFSTMKIVKITVGKKIFGMTVNSYLIAHANTCIIVDPGDEGEKICNTVIKNHWTPKSIILTHGHFDHIKDAKFVAQQFNLPIFIHEFDKSFLTTPNLNLATVFGFSFEGIDSTDYLHDGDIFELGDLKIKVIHTPGHTPGSICLMCNDCLITGDTLFKRMISRTDLPGGDEDALMDSLDKLFSLKGDYKVYPGHEDITKLLEEKKYNEKFEEDGFDEDEFF